MIVINRPISWSVKKACMYKVMYKNMFFFFFEVLCALQLTQQNW